MWEELENALAWYAAAPKRWVKSAKQDLSAAAEWIWEVLQGDFNDEQSTAQIATGTAISMIPFVDQLCDVRDVIANCRKIDEDNSSKLAWLGLVLTLIGLFPVLGSLVKGCLKILFGYARKGIFKAGAKAVESGLWQATQPFVESGIAKLNQHLASPAVRKTLSFLKIDNIYSELAKNLRVLKGKLSTAALLKVFDETIGVLNELADLMKKWGNAALQTKVGQMLIQVKRIRDLANSKLGEFVKPMQDWLDKLAQRLDVESRLGYKAASDTVNAHNFLRVSNDAQLEAFQKNKPDWVDKTDRIKNPAEEISPKKDGWSPIDETAPRPLQDAFRTFRIGTIKAVTYPPGTKLYRVLDPKSNDNSICWISEVEYKKLRNKSDWRRRFAVWADWNSNGEVVTYLVPPGDGLKAWEGIVGSQTIQNAKRKTEYVLEGGATQIVLDPKHLDQKYLGKREFTGWNYDDFGKKTELVGVPILQTNWRK